MAKEIFKIVVKKYCGVDNNWYFSIIYIWSISIWTYIFAYNRFLPYKIGVDLKPDPNLKDKYFVIYKNKNTGQLEEYPANQYPWMIAYGWQNMNSWILE